MSPRLLLVPVAVALILLGLVTIVHGQGEGSLSMRLDLPSQPATPGGDEVKVPYSISYLCETLWKAQTKIEVEASTDETGVTPTAVPGEWDPTRVPDCSAGDTVTHRGNITVSIAADAAFLVTDEPEITVTASGVDQLDRPINVTQTTTIAIAPIVSLDYTTPETAIMAEPGELVTILINVTSMSNDEVTVSTSIPDWNLTDTPPDIIDVTLDMPADNGTPENQVEILFEVPSDAEATTHTFTVQLAASPAGNRTLVVTENITYELTVEEKKRGGGGKDSPGPAVPALLVVTIAAAVLLRRRR